MKKNESRLVGFLTNSRSQAVRDALRALREQSQTTVADDPADRLSITAACYIALLTLAAGLCIGFFAPDISSKDWQGFVTLILLAIIFERVGIRIYGKTHVSAGVVALFAVAIVSGASGAAIAAPLVVLAATAFTRSRWHTRLFDMSSYTLANVSAALVFHALIDVETAVSVWWVPAAFLAIVANYAVNAWLVAVVMSRYSGERWLAMWQEEHSWIFPYYIAFGLLALALATAYLALGVPGILAFVVPPLMMRFALHQYVTKTEQTVLELRQKNADLETANHNIMQMTRQLTETYDGTLEALVLALDARDRETKGHSFRVASYVLAMARQLEIEEESQAWVDMQRGALLHDVGKIGVPDHVLHKAGPLTPEEWDDMKHHPQIGYEMLKDISFLSGAADIVHAHHERFDGKGYPRGLAGDEIPLGARIFAAADAFDAMTSERPYRKPLPPEMARDEILRHSGTQFDPQVVQVFLFLYEGLEKTAIADHREEHARAA